MRHRGLVAEVMAFAMVVPSLAEAGPAEGRDVTVRLDVDTSALPNDRYTKALRGSVVKRQTETLGRAGVDVRDGAEEVLRIEIGRYGEDDIHYRAKLGIVGDEREGATREITCEACTDAQLLEKVDAETAGLAELLVREEPEAEPVAVPTETVDGPQEPVAEPVGTAEPAAREPEERERRIGVAGHAGIASLTLGLGLGIGGVALAVAEPELRLQPDSDQTYDEIDRRPAGHGLAAAGASLLVAGVVLIAVDQTVLRRRRARSSAAIIVPSLSSTGAGLTVVRRF